MVDPATIPAARRLRPLGRALALARAAGVPNWAVAQEAQISKSYLSMIANGQASPSDDVAGRISKALEVPTTYLFPGR